MHPADICGPRDRLVFAVSARVDEDGMFGAIDIVPVVDLWDHQRAIERRPREGRTRQRLGVGERRDRQSIVGDGDDFHSWRTLIEILGLSGVRDLMLEPVMIAEALYTLRIESEANREGFRGTTRYLVGT